MKLIKSDNRGKLSEQALSKHTKQTTHSPPIARFDPNYVVDFW